MLSKDLEEVDLQDFLNALVIVAVIWFVLAFFSFGEFACANLIAGFLLLCFVGIAIQNIFIWISPYLIWMALVPLIPIGFWLGKVLEKRLATGRGPESVEGNPGPKREDRNQIPPF